MKKDQKQQNITDIKAKLEPLFSHLLHLQLPYPSEMKNVLTCHSVVGSKLGTSVFRIIHIVSVQSSFCSKNSLNLWLLSLNQFAARDFLRKVNPIILSLLTCQVGGHHYYQFKSCCGHSKRDLNIIFTGRNKRTVWTRYFRVAYRQMN